MCMNIALYIHFFSCGTNTIVRSCDKFHMCFLFTPSAFGFYSKIDFIIIIPCAKKKLVTDCCSIDFVRKQLNSNVFFYNLAENIFFGERSFVNFDSIFQKQTKKTSENGTQNIFFHKGYHIEFHNYEFNNNLIKIFFFSFFFGIVASKLRIAIQHCKMEKLS